jgi:hypothetical protein
MLSALADPDAPDERRLSIRYEVVKQERVADDHWRYELIFTARHGEARTPVEKRWTMNIRLEPGGNGRWKIDEPF